MVIFSGRQDVSCRLSGTCYSSILPMGLHIYIYIIHSLQGGVMSFHPVLGSAMMSQVIQHNTVGVAVFEMAKPCSLICSGTVALYCIFCTCVCVFVKLEFQCTGAYNVLQWREFNAERLVGRALWVPKQCQHRNCPPTNSSLLQSPGKLKVYFACVQVSILERESSKVVSTAMFLCRLAVSRIRRRTPGTPSCAVEMFCIAQQRRA